MKKIIALLLALVMVLSLVACSASEDTATDEMEDEATVEEDASGETAADVASSEDILVVGYDAFSQKFSPFFATTQYDMDVGDIVSQHLLATDREGNVLMNGIEGETASYNGTDYTYYGIANCETVENEDGTVDYNITMREDIYFSDGTNMTADDAIFTMYVLCDPTYEGASTLYTVPIVGLEEYRSGVDTMMNLMLAAGEDNTDFSLWTEEDQTAFWFDLDQAGTAFAQEIVDHCMENGATDVASAASMWTFTLEEDATVEDFFALMCETYDWDLRALSDTESAGSSLFDLMENYAKWSTGIQTGESAANISGIQKTGDYSFTVTTSKIDAAAIYQLNFNVAPMHYYGDASLYDYENSMFGFNKGDLSLIKEKNRQPLGAGPYKFVFYKDGIVAFAANENYWKGEPKIKNMLWRETSEADKLTGVVSGSFDITDPAFSPSVVDSLKTCNSNGELTGDVITTSTVPNLGYGYIGICANTVNVDGEPGSDASKNLRKAFATIFAAHRDTVIDAYYGASASVIQYPISSTSWAAPTASDEDYELAYSTDVGDNQLYTADMTEEAKYAAAVEAARGYLEAAGYTFDENGVATAAPAGASLTYEVLIPANGAGDHPAYGILTAAKDELAALGITLDITDLSDTTQLWDSLDAGTCEMWAIAWNSTDDPDMYQIYHSTNVVTNAEGTGSNYYHIQDENLDAMIMEARSTTDQAHRKSLYKDCLEIILDWGVEIPIYQRQNAIIFSTERVNMDTVTPDITPAWDWMNDIELLEMD